jgi:hypothetical protein
VYLWVAMSAYEVGWGWVGWVGYDDGDWGQ